MVRNKFKNMKDAMDYVYRDASSTELREFFSENVDNNITGDMTMPERLRRMKKAGLIQIGK